MKLGDIARLIDVVVNPCWRKQRWRSKGAAEAHKRALLKAPFVKDPDLLNTFQCPYCGWYHVGRTGGSDGRRSRRLQD